MSEKFLITRPTHDDRVSYLDFWSKDIIKFAEDKNIKYSDFRGKKANKEEVTKFLQKQNPKLVIFNGHGTDSIIFGHKNQPLIVSNENDILLKEKIVYAIACDCASKLGITAREKGCKAFIGYTQPFGFVKDASKECIPNKDEFAKPFKEFSNEVSLALLKGKTAKEAKESSQKVATKLLKFYSGSDALPEYKEIRFWLFWDKYFQELIGEGSAKFLEV